MQQQTILDIARPTIQDSRKRGKRGVIRGLKNSGFYGYFLLTSMYNC